MENFRIDSKGMLQQVFRNLESQHGYVMHALANHLSRWSEVAKRLGGDFTPDTDPAKGGTGQIFGKHFTLHFTPAIIDREIYGLIRISGFNPISNKPVEIDSYLINENRRMLSPTTVAEFDGDDAAKVEYTVICEVLYSVLESRFQ